MRIKEIFSNIAYKKLVNVDLPNGKSNQHEFNGTSNLRVFFADLLSNGKFHGNVDWFYFNDEHVLGDKGEVTFYNAREKDKTRNEWRLYYSGEFLSCAKLGDYLILIRTNSSNYIYCLVFDQNYSYIHSIKKLFGIDNDQLDSFINLSEDKINREINYAERLIFEQIGFDQFIPKNDEDIEIIKREFGSINFPKTIELSRLAQKLITNCDPIYNIDATFIKWLDREEQLFKAIETFVIKKELEDGFINGSVVDVDRFIEFSLSVHNRRKSRMGLSFENHFEAILNINKIKFIRNPRIHEDSSEKHPDFIFPSIEEYYKEYPDLSQLKMVALKSTCKDRWRQILKEADKIEKKHLCTLEQGISDSQINEMITSDVILIFPQQIKETYQDSEFLGKFVNLQDFINEIKKLQGII